MIKLRLAQKTDLEELSKIYIQVYSSLNLGEDWSFKETQRLLNFFYRYQADLFFVAEAEHGIAGAVVALVKPWWDGNRLADGELFVRPNYQRKGVGTILVKKLLSEASRHYGATHWDTYTHVVREHPMRWYRKLGFKEVEQYSMMSGNIQEILDRLKKEDREK